MYCSIYASERIVTGLDNGADLFAVGKNDPESS